MVGETYSLHRNGGGRIIGALGGAGGDCFVDRHSRLEDRSFVSYRSSITKSILKNTSVGFSEINDSVIVDSHIVGATINESALEDVIIRGAANRKAEIDRVSLSGDVVIEGCRVRDFELHGPYLLHRDWDRVPRHYLLETDGGVVLGLAECTEDRYHVGCICRNFSNWDEKEPLLQKFTTNKKHWPPDLTATIRLVFEGWRNSNKLSG